MKKNHIGNMSLKTLYFNTPYVKIFDKLVFIFPYLSRITRCNFLKKCIDIPCFRKGLGSRYLTFKDTSHVYRPVKYLIPTTYTHNIPYREVFLCAFHLYKEDV